MTKMILFTYITLPFNLPENVSMTFHLSVLIANINPGMFHTFAVTKLKSHIREQLFILLLVLHMCIRYWFDGL